MPEDTPQRRTFTPQFKTDIVLEALQGEKTIRQIADEHQLNPVQVSEWKRQALEVVEGAFHRGGSQGAEKKRLREMDALRRQVESLQKLVEQREYELEWLRKKSRELGR